MSSICQGLGDLIESKH